MNRGIAGLLLCVLCTGFAFPFLATQDPPAGDRATMWKKVDDAVNQGLPKSALEALEPILQQALSEKDYPEAVRAIAKRSILKSQIEGGDPLIAIKQLKQELETAPDALRQPLQAILGHWYWTYFQQNRWRFANRSQTASPPSEDIATWDLKRLFDEIDRAFAAALEPAEATQKIPIAAFDAMLTQNDFPDTYRPTLYDFLAHTAIDFYAAGEQAGVQSLDAFVLDADSPALGSADEFLVWKPETTDVESPYYKAVLLYQALMQFHAKDADPSARLDADLDRLQFVQAHGVGEEKTNRTLAALKRFAETNASHPLSALARHRWATLLRNDNHMVDAHAIATQGKNAFPESIGGRLCSQLIADIESKSLDVQSERVWNAPWLKLRVQYRNVTQAHFRIVRADWRSRFTRQSWNPEHVTRDELAKLKQSPTVAAWSVDLPATDDYLPSTHDVDVPKDLPPGFYIVLYSNRNDFAVGEGVDNDIGAATAWVSKLAIVTQADWSHSGIQGLIVDNQTGAPIAGANVRALHRDHNTGIMQDGATVTTDGNGVFRFSATPNNTFLLATHDGHSVSTFREFSSYSQQSPEPRPKVVFFTDRAIYRPGQRVRFKGIAMILDPKNNRYDIVKNTPTNVEFIGPNGQVVETLELRTNDFGSFAGTFSAPRNAGTGMMHIRATAFEGSIAQIRVEEYKRPKFFVEVEAPKDTPRLNDRVTVTGKATSYTGAPIQNAQVKYQVIRTVRWPDWFVLCYGWRIAPMQSNSQKVGQGVATTDANGNFQVEFVAKPDRSVPESDQPIFHFSITADVIDGTGETRSDETGVSIGYNAMQASLAADAWQTTGSATQLRVRTTNLSDNPIAAAGQIKIYRLKEPETILKPDLLGERRPRASRAGRRNGRGLPFNPMTPEPDRSQISQWPLGDLVTELPFKTGEDGNQELKVELPRGVFRAVLESQDRLGKPVRSELNLTVIQPDAPQLGIKLPHLFATPKTSLQPGETWTGVWGSGYESARAYVEVEHRGKTLQSYWTPANRTQIRIEQPVDESLRGGFTVRVTFVRDNRLYTESRIIEVPWSNKDLQVRWERFRSKLEPGAKEKWSLKVSGPNAASAAAELVAGMYDASLDAYAPHAWPAKLSGFYQEVPRFNTDFGNQAVGFMRLFDRFSTPLMPVPSSYRRFRDDLLPQLHMEMEYARMRGAVRFGTGMPGGVPGAPMPMPASAMVPMERGAGGFALSKAMASDGRGVSEDAAGESPVAPSGAQLDLGSVSPRQNLNETAFFFPQVRIGDDGTATLEFTMPEALTSWRFLGFAHDADLRSGSLFDKVVTAKDLMVQPNPPRFVREGDVIEFSAKVTNQSNSVQRGKVALQLNEAVTEASLDASFGLTQREQTFEIPANQSQSFHWRLKIPEGATPFLHRTVAATESLSDGEQGMLPVLSNRLLVHESIQLPIRGKSTKEFELKKLLESAGSKTLKNESLTIQMTSQPAWYAVLALPYLMEFPHECSEQTFNRFYANALARHIATSDPKIARVFEVWRETQPEALESPLAKNEDIKSILIEETPWLRAAKKESQARRNVGLLFESNRLETETGSAYSKLLQMQRENGMWPWFPGGPDNEYLTLYIVTGFGRLRNLGVAVDEAAALRALDRLDAWMHERYDSIKDKDPAKSTLSPTIALYLYGRSFFVDQRPIAPEYAAAISYWKAQARDHWLKLDRQGQAHIAIGMKRMGDTKLPESILKSLRERSVSNEEMGMFWRDTENSWWWYQAPIETQAMMIEAFDEVVGDEHAVNECKVWLLKQKQTQDWKTTKATADAVYALLRRGENWLRSDALVSVKLGDVEIQPEKVEAGTGFYEQRIAGSDVRPEMGRVTVTKPDAGVSWGGLHWQYLEDIDRITPHDGTPLHLEKKIYRRSLPGKGDTLSEVDGPVQIGDELVCRVVLRCDRDMEYVHMKDYRGSGTEPVNVLSGYRFQDGLFYYESTRDTATHFFIDYLRKGTYVFEYSVRVQHAGDYPMGYASIECMYAPEFNSHSGSVRLQVQSSK